MAIKHKNRPQLPLTELPENRKITFSFEYYDTSCDDYCISNQKWSKEQIKKALGRLKDISSKSFNQLRKERGVYHFYEVYWEQTIKKEEFPNPAVNHMSPFHFALLGVNRQLARVYGAYYAGTFFIVWFDLDHEIWHSPLKHT
ncbi:hypothetical protein CO054_00525 [Candidatus Shapirobacteria bacterium CG_4_9_14_0_2_um_filter_39_11]|uniref:Uncharacterized protein n=1 Tax=Candidatus Shapirobacteria bacterium CG_4_9_14_0_2_um_filter_39_11 TaxID=1974478 RepID=A0A2M8ETD6_9BACT|nr:MAG: hypothetical protein CO054_00525 [Candidatus Shapirobacteria bacterium CG_4_9_14_0_2_um_filter_39_11]